MATLIIVAVLIIMDVITQEVKTGHLVHGANPSENAPIWCPGRFISRASAITAADPRSGHRKKQPLPTCINRCSRSGRHDRKTRQLLFGALRGISVQSPYTMELGDNDGVRVIISSPLAFKGPNLPADPVGCYRLILSYCGPNSIAGGAGTVGAGNGAGAGADGDEDEVVAVGTGFTGHGGGGGSGKP